MNAHGLTPGQQVWLWCRGDRRNDLIAHAEVNENGDLHIQGAWGPKWPDLTASTSPTFYLGGQHASPSGGYCYMWSAYTITTFFTQVYGYIEGAKDNPDGTGTHYIRLPNQEVKVYKHDKKTDEYVYWGKDTTNDNGVFKVTKAFWGYGRDYKAVYEGGVYDGVGYQSCYDFAERTPDSL